MYLIKPNLLKKILKFTIVLYTILIISVYMYVMYNRITGTGI